MQTIAPLLEVQSRWSALPSKDALLIEQMHSREGAHLFVYPFCGRLANEGIATLVAARWARESPSWQQRIERAAQQLEAQASRAA